MKDSEFKIKFLGGAGTVTGSKTIIETPKKCAGFIDVDEGLVKDFRDVGFLLQQGDWNDAVEIRA